MFVWFPELIYGQMFSAFYREFMKYQFFMIESPIVDTLVYLDIFFRISTKLLIRIDAIFSVLYCHCFWLNFVEEKPLYHCRDRIGISLMQK